MIQFIKLDTMKKVYDFVKIAEKCPLRILIKQYDYVVDAKSVLGICSLDLSELLIMDIPNYTKHGLDDYLDDFNKLLEELKSANIVQL